MTSHCNERILITGAQWFVGLHAVRYFLQRGYIVRAMTRSGRLSFDHERLEVVQADMRDIDSLFRATTHVSYVIHLAAAKQDEKDSFENNVKGAESLSWACAANSVNAIINISTTSTKIDKQGRYGRTKDEADKLLMQGKVPVTTLKPSIIYGDLKHAVFGSLATFSRLPITPVFGSGECVFRPIHVSDLCKVFEIAIDDQALRGKTYDVAGPDPVSLNELIKSIGTELLRKKVRIVHIPERVGFILARILSQIFYRPPITQSNILGSTQSAPLDFDSFVREFNFRPMSLSEGFDLLKKQNHIFDESELILSYVVSRSSLSLCVTDRERGIYNKAITYEHFSQQISPAVFRYTWLLGPLDLLSRFYSNSLLTRKLYIAAAVIEGSPLSAPWLLPHPEPFLKVMIRSVKLCFSFGIKLILAFFVSLNPSFVRRNVT